MLLLKRGASLMASITQRTLMVTRPFAASSVDTSITSSRSGSYSRLFSSMSAIQVHETGDESKLLLNPNTAIPELEPTQCLIENQYAGLNFHDTYTRSGLYPLKLPFVVGCEGGGIVQRVGSQVDGIQKGDRVVYLQEGEHGSYAQYTNVQYTRLMPVPDSVDLDLATAVAVQGLTAHYLVHDCVNLQKGDWVLVHSAAGGTGQIIVQMAKLKGANVIGTCSTKEKAQIAKARGCDFVLLTKSNPQQPEDDIWPNLAEQVREIVTKHSTEPIQKANYGNINLNDGVHCVFDGVGKTSAMASLESLNPRGTAVFYGNASGPPPDIPPLLLSKLGSLILTRPKMHDFIATQQELVERSSRVFQMLMDSEIAVNIQERVPFDQAGVVRATKMLHNRQTVGKVLFDISKGLESHQTAADHIWTSRTAADKVDKLNTSLAPSTIQDGYSIQTFLQRKMLGEIPTTQPVGYKIAATSQMAQESVEVQEPFYGSLYSHSTFSSPATIHAQEESSGLQEQFMLIEPEFAVKMSEDLDISTEHTLESISSTIGSIFASVEIATSAYDLSHLENFKNIGAPSLIADNACHGALVLGTEFSADPNGDDNDFSKVLKDLDQHSCELKVNGEVMATGSGKNVLGHPLHALCWLANELGKRGESLQKDQIITTGVVVDKMVLAKVGDTVTVDYGPLLGSVALDFEK